MTVLSTECANPARRAYRILRIRMSEASARTSETVEIRRERLRVTSTAQQISVMLIRYEMNEVKRSGHWRRG